MNNLVDARVIQGTHIPMLVKVFELTQGDVLELGSGFFSTTLLRWLCQMNGRTLYSLESHDHYYQLALKKPAEYHKVIKVNYNWDSPLLEKHWGMVLVDHWPNERRWKEIEKLANFAEYIIIHDSNLSDVKRYGYEKIWGLFKYRYDYTKLNPNTTVVSNFHDLKEFK